MAFYVSCLNVSFCFLHSRQDRGSSLPSTGFSRYVYEAVDTNHDAWVIERWDSLHCIWRWLAAAFNESHTSVW